MDGWVYYTEDEYGNKVFLSGEVVALRLLLKYGLDGSEYLRVKSTPEGPKFEKLFQVIAGGFVWKSSDRNVIE
jgi:hypothetical protein